METFDHNGASKKGTIFGLPYAVDQAAMVLIPVPWEVTVSYRTGTAYGAAAILNASTQIDLYSTEIERAWTLPVAMVEESVSIRQESDRLRSMAVRHLDALENGKMHQEETSLLLNKINEGCESLNIYIKSLSLNYLREGKVVGLVGGDHSTPLGLLRALSEKYDRFGVLQIDAHADLRKAYEGFTYSHASIMYNALKLPAISRLVQIGIRDFCEEEQQVMNRAMGRVKTYFDRDLKAQQFNGTTWRQQCDHILEDLPQLVYISFDIDGLDPALCPNTGTPVPGGFRFEEIAYLLSKLADSERKIIGFDLNEVAPGSTDWDANVGARMLWELCLTCGLSNNILSKSARANEHPHR